MVVKQHNMSKTPIYKNAFPERLDALILFVELTLVISDCHYLSL